MRIAGFHIKTVCKRHPSGLSLELSFWTVSRYFHVCRFGYPGAKVRYQVRRYDRTKGVVLYQRDWR